MGHARNSTVEALILRSFDVGEADRFCILLTKERGRMPVRARGVRKPGSRLGAVLLPLQHVRLDIEDHSAGIFAKSGTLLHMPESRSAHALAVCHEAAEMVLRLTEDMQESGDLFDHCCEFFATPRDERSLMPFTARLLSLLGVLPLSMDDPRYAALNESEQITLHSCVSGQTRSAKRAQETLDQFVTLILHEHLRSPMVSPGVRMQIGR